MAKKPQERWDTGVHQALRDDSAESTLGARAEVFDLHFSDGRKGRAELGLGEQRVDEASLKADPELAFAVRAWLLARGQRSLRLCTFEGREIEAGSIAPGDLDRVGAPDPDRGIISLAPSNYDLAQALGLLDRGFLACEDSTTPAAGLDPVRLGPDLNPDLDKAAALGPALYLASLSVPGMERVIMGLRRRSLPHVVFAPRTLDEIEADFGRLAQAADIDPVPAQAKFRAQRVLLAKRARRLKRPVRVFLEWWPRPQFSPGADCYSNEMIALAGGVNVFGDRPGSSLEVSPSEVAQRDPEVAFVSWCGVDYEKLDPGRLAKHPELAEQDFVRERRVFALDEALSGRPGPSVLLAAQEMARVIADYASTAGLWEGS